MGARVEARGREEKREGTGRKEREGERAKRGKGEMGEGEGARQAISKSNKPAWNQEAVGAP